MVGGIISAMAEEIPEDAAGWRALLGSLPPRALWKIVQADIALSRRVLTGFRPGPDSLRHPAVLARLAEAARRDPALAESLRALPPEERSAPAPPPPPAPAPADDTGAKQREKLRELRQALRERDARIVALEAERAAARQGEAQAQEELRQEREARRQADARAERLQRERSARRTAPPGPRAAPAPAPPSPASGPPLALEEAFRRLLHHGKFAAVADLCRELLAEPETTAAERGAIHVAYAHALGALGRDDEAEEQEARAVDAWLGAGRWTEATEAFLRPLVVRPHPLSVPETRRFSRLLALAARADQQETVRRSLVRLRFLAPESYRGLQSVLVRGGALAPFRGLLDAPKAPPLAPDQAVALPTHVRSAASVTPRRLVDAVAEGEERLVAAAREGIEALRLRDPDLADALLEAVEALAPEAVFPLSGRPRGAVVVDAANVALHHPDPLARLVAVADPPASAANLAQIRRHLLRRGFFPVVLLADASLRYRVDDRSGYEAMLALGMVRETPPGTAADEALLFEARERRAPLVTNDRLSEWGDRARGIERLGFDLLPGGIHLTPA